MTATVERVIWRPNPGPQTEFLSCPARETLYAGSVGAGKSDALLMAAVSQTGNPLHRALILRRTFPMLRDMVGRSHELFLPLGASYTKQENSWRFPSGAVVEFGYCDAPEDVYRYMGRAFSFIGWDELTSWPGDGTDPQGRPCSSAYLYLMSRLRAVEGSGLRLSVAATCTPNGIGSTWVKQRWNIPDSGAASEVIDPQSGFRRVFIPARISDNPYLAGTSYERSLAALPEAQRKALLEGRWDTYEGAVFSEWNYQRHTCEPFQVHPSWPIFRSCDDGYAAPACVLWFAHDKIYERLFVVREAYQSGMTPEVMARAVLDIDATFLDADDEPRGISGVIDAASFADTGLGGGRANRMNAMGCKWSPSVKFPGSRVAGLAAIHSWLANRNDGWPGLVIFRTCRNLISQLPALPYSTKNPEDASEEAEDHAVEALRIGLTRQVRTFKRVAVSGI